MSRFYSYINSATAIIDQYQGQEPLAVYLKQFFAANKKYGSKDRKHIAALCYHYYRVAKAVKSGSVSDKLLVSTVLCESEPSPLLEVLKPEWNQIISQPIADKIAFLGAVFDNDALFSFVENLSPGIDKKAFAASFLSQPKLFLRIRPGHENVVTAKLKSVAVPFEQLSDNCLALPNGTKLEDDVLIDKEVVVQDYNSQQVGEVLRPYLLSHTLPPTVWDCCAASGGKSIMLYDINRKVKLLVSDIRSSILHNLQNRFQRAGIQHYQSFVCDLSSDGEKLSAAQKFNFIVADVPCTGSGTWARTPEQSYFFKRESIDEFAYRQQKILSHVIPHLASGGYLVYITCSVFKKENEDMVAYLQQSFGLELMEMHLLKGYDRFADTMFVAILKKN